MRHLLDSAFFNEIENLEIAGVISSNSQAQALTRARNLHVPTFVVDAELFPNTASYGTALQNKLRDIDTDFVVLDGFAPALGAAAKYYHGRIIAVRLTAEQQCMDVTTYFADEQGGVGCTIETISVALEEEDTPDSFARRVYDRAERLLMAAIRACCAEE